VRTAGDDLRDRRRLRGDPIGTQAAGEELPDFVVVSRSRVTAAAMSEPVSLLPAVLGLAVGWVVCSGLVELGVVVLVPGGEWS
jgi:hypothetical protein